MDTLVGVLARDMLYTMVSEEIWRLKKAGIWYSKCLEQKEVTARKRDRQVDDWECNQVIL